MAARTRISETVARERDKEAEIKKEPRFTRLDDSHILAIETCLRRYPIFQGRMEIHLPARMAQQMISRERVVVWPKFDRYPVCLLIFMDGYPPAVWDIGRHTGYGLRISLPPGFAAQPIILLANLLKVESVLQIEDLVINHGIDIWSSLRFSDRWELLRTFWECLPMDQPRLGVTMRVVSPVSLEDWPDVYDASLSWIIQPDRAKNPRYFWWDSTKPRTEEKTYRAPVLTRVAALPVLLCLLARQNTRVGLPDSYALTAADGEEIGVAAVTSLTLSRTLRENMRPEGRKVKVVWNPEFEKYEIVCLLDDSTALTAASFFVRH